MDTNPFQVKDEEQLQDMTVKVSMKEKIEDVDVEGLKGKRAQLHVGITKARIFRVPPVSS